MCSGIDGGYLVQRSSLLCGSVLIDDMFPSVEIHCQLTEAYGRECLKMMTSMIMVAGAEELVLGW
jgi:hypothetical protein